MEKRVLDCFTANILEEAACRFGLNPGAMHLKSDVENFVYEHGTNEDGCILRITHSSHRTKEEIGAEFEWMEYLCTHGVSVPRPIRSVNGSLIEVIGSGRSHFMVTAFRKIPGKTILDADECTPEIYEQWGRSLGKMHTLAKQFEPGLTTCKRREWHAEDLVINAEKYIPDQKGILKKQFDLIKHLNSLPKDRNCFGLIHADFTDVNFFVHDHRIIVFDFDDCQYHWFAYDIATILYDLPWLPHGRMDGKEFLRHFWGSFYKGYSEENDLEGFWIAQLDDFIRLREINLYVAYQKKWDLENLSEKRRAFLSEMRMHIEQGSISIDLAELVE